MASRTGRPGMFRPRSSPGGGWSEGRRNRAISRRAGRRSQRRDRGKGKRHNAVGPLLILRHTRKTTHHIPSTRYQAIPCQRASAVTVPGWILIIADPDLHHMDLPSAMGKPHGNTPGENPWGGPGTTVFHGISHGAIPRGKYQGCVFSHLEPKQILETAFFSIS